jgi:dTDP-4-dehydrorhamnose reductase
VKILITGSTGLLGQALLRHLAREADVLGLSRRAPSSPHGGRHLVCDLTDAAKTREAVKGFGPDLVIHAQALSDVDRCQREPELGRSLNVGTTENLVAALERPRPRPGGSAAATLLYVSTDYVFDGTKGAPYDETDAPHPINRYGAWKLESEQRVLRYARSAVVRVSTLFGPGRVNFCDQIAAALRAGQPVEAFVDQVTSPTYTDDAAGAIAELCGVLRDAGGPARARVFHVTNAGGCSRARFAHRVAELLGAPRDLIREIPMAAQQRPAPRPPYSALATTQLPRTIRRRLRPWDDALQAYLAEHR